MADNSQLALAALALLIFYVLIQVRRDRFVMHMLNRMDSASGKPGRKLPVKRATPARKKKSGGSRRRR